jgi:hypothetical protein
MLMYKDNVALFKDVATRPHRMNPDALAKSPHLFKFQAVDDKLTSSTRRWKSCCIT